MKRNPFFTCLLVCTCLFINKAESQGNQHGTFLSKTIHSVILKENKVGLNTERNVRIYLPPGYATSGKRYPVVYYLHNFYTNNAQLLRTAS